MIMKKINILVERTKTGYSAFAEDMPDYSTGKYIVTLKKGILEA